MKDQLPENKPSKPIVEASTFKGGNKKVVFEPVKGELWVDTKKWLKIRDFVLKRDKKCLFCSKRNRLIVHHIDENGHDPNYSSCNNSLGNLVVLCRSCHAKLHQMLFRSRNRQY